IIHHFGWRYPFCCTFPILLQPLTADSDGGRYPPPCPAEPGLSSPRSPGRFAEANRSAFRAATVRPACGSTFIILCRLRTIHPKSVVRIRQLAFLGMRLHRWPRTTDFGPTLATVKFDCDE